MFSQLELHLSQLHCVRELCTCNCNALTCIFAAHVRVSLLLVLLWLWSAVVWSVRSPLHCWSAKKAWLQLPAMGVLHNRAVLPVLGTRKGCMQVAALPWQSGAWMSYRCPVDNTLGSYRLALNHHHVIEQRVMMTHCCWIFTTSYVAMYGVNSFYSNESSHMIKNSTCCNMHIKSCL